MTECVTTVGSRSRRFPPASITARVADRQTAPDGPRQYLLPAREMAGARRRLPGLTTLPVPGSRSVCARHSDGRCLEFRAGLPPSGSLLAADTSARQRSSGRTSRACPPPRNADLRGSCWRVRGRRNPGPLLRQAPEYIDTQIRAIVDRIARDGLAASTTVILSAKHASRRSTRACCARRRRTPRVSTRPRSTPPASPPSASKPTPADSSMRPRVTPRTGRHRHRPARRRLHLRREQDRRARRAGTGRPRRRPRRLRRSRHTPCALARAEPARAAGGPDRAHLGGAASVTVQLPTVGSHVVHRHVDTSSQRAGVVP